MMTDFAFQDGHTVIFAGDSITDCGRRGNEKPYGEGYVRRTIELITARYPARQLTYFNAGIGGNTVQDLKGRWQDDVLNRNPDWVTIKIGINDLHRLLNATPGHPTFDDFEADYRDIIERTRKAGARPVLIDPFYISTDFDSGSFRSQVLRLLPDYLAVVQKLAREYETLHVKTHELFVEQLKYRVAEDFCPEPVHPYLSGHLVISHGLLAALNW